MMLNKLQNYGTILSSLIEYKAGECGISSLSWCILLKLDWTID